MAVLPVHPMLAPGVALTRRDPGTLQLGFDPEPLVLLPDDALTGEALRCLREHRTTEDPRVRGVLLRLAADGLLADADHVATTDRLGRALASRTGVDAATRLTLRAGTRVHLDLPASWRGAWSDDLRACGLLPSSADPTDGDAEVVQTVAVVARPAGALAAAADRWVGEQVPHLLVAVGARGHRLGPFVSPGLTACARCLQAHLVEADPSRPAELTDATPESDPVLDLRARAEGVSEVVRWAEGLRPRLWSATCEVSLESGLEPRPWRRHPWCGCAWDELA